MERALLVTEWRTLAVANYAVTPAVLAPYVPPGTELDTWDGVAYVSLVGFEWVRPRLWGVPAPFHDRFAELNLRTYVRQGDRRGVVFIKEIVGMPIVAWLGRDVFHENFTLARVEADVSPHEVTYRWFTDGGWSRLAFQLGEEPPPASDFFLERDWAFTATRDGATMAYPVQRASGRVRAAVTTEVTADWVGLYGPALGAGLLRPTSAFVAEGSPVRVGFGRLVGMERI